MGRLKRRASQGGTKHGFCIPLGGLPRKFSYVTAVVREFRRALEQWVAENNDGQIDLLQAMTIQTCARYEQASQCGQRYLKENPDLPPLDKQNLAMTIAKASDLRDAALRKLGLSAVHDGDRRARIPDPFQSAIDVEAPPLAHHAADSEPLTQPDPTATPTTNTAADGQPGGQAGSAADTADPVEDVVDRLVGGEHGNTHT